MRNTATDAKELFQFMIMNRTRIIGVAGMLMSVGGLYTAACRTENLVAAESGASQQKPLLKGQGANGDWTTDAPGVRRLISPADIPAPYHSQSIDNGPKIVARPEGAWPKAPDGFKVDHFASGLQGPREITTAPNGDIFVTESGPARVKVLRDTNGDGKADSTTVFVDGLERPFGLAFYPLGRNPSHLYVANTGSVVRFPYKNGDTTASRPREVIVPDLPGGGQLRGGGHWTRDVAFTRDGKKMLVSVGSRSNVHEDPNVDETRRASILEYNPDGTGYQLFANGIRNPVSIAIHPQTGDVWASVNERDGIGDDLPPEYITRVKRGGFYGWPWFYIGGNWDPRHSGKQPELKDKVIVPDVLIQSHSASLGMLFYTGSQFPKEYHNDGFAAEHGSWNRAKRTGYKVIRILLKNGKPTGEYEDFLVGFVTPDGNVYGRPVGVTVASDGALLVSDDASGTIWRVSYTGK
jgi:glucose/arabinose dehydrogenase